LPPATEVQPCRLLGIGHTISMDLSADGMWAAYGSAEGGITIIGVTDFVARRTITAHPSPVTAVAFSPDATQIASADAQGNLALWTVEDGSQVWAGQALDGRVLALVFGTPGSLWALTAGGLYAIDAASGAHGQAAAVGAGAAALAISPDGGTLALGDTDGGYRLLGAADLAVGVSVPAAHPGGVTDLRISANGQRLVTGGSDGTTALWDLAGNLLARVSQPGVAPVSVDLNADGTLLAAGVVSPAGAFAFRPDGTLLVNYIGFPTYTRLSRDATWLISMTTAAETQKEPVDDVPGAGGGVWDDSFTAAAFSPDGRYVAEGVFDNVRLWDTQTGEMVRMLDTTPPIYTPPDGISFSPDGTALARNDYNRNVYLFRTSDSALLAQYSAPGLGGYSLVYSPDGQWLANPGASSVLLWRVADGSSGPTGFVGQAGQAPTAVAFSPDGSTLAVGDAGGAVGLWSFPAGAQKAAFTAVPAAIRQISFSVDGTRVMAGDQVNDLALFTTAGVPVARWPQQPSWYFSFSPDGEFLATVAPAPSTYTPTGPILEPTEILLSSPTTGAPLAAYTSTVDLGPNQAYVSQPIIAFSPTDHRLLIADVLGRVLCLP